MIPYGRHKITEEDIDEVIKVLRSDFITQGPVVNEFEKNVSKYCGAKHAIAVNSATSALHIACLALNLGPGDLLWTSPNTFVASANCAIYCGANVDFVDIDPNTFNMSVSSLSDKLKIAEKKGKLPKIVIPVHFAGQPCDMRKINDLSKQYGFKIIEDASHAIGASYEEIKVGSCTHSDITVFSFHPVKIITTGEGGMALTNDEKLSDTMRMISTHGITKNKKFMQKRPLTEIWNYQQIILGFNYRMSDIQAALGLSQIKRIDEYIDRRRRIAKYYDDELKNLSLITPLQEPNFLSSYHLYPILIKSNSKNKCQKVVYRELIKNGIAVNLHYIPVHRQPFFENFGFKKNDFPVSEKIHKEIISIPIYPSLSIKKQKKVIETLSYILK